MAERIPFIPDLTFLIEAILFSSLGAPFLFHAICLDAYLTQNCKSIYRDIFKRKGTCETQIVCIHIKRILSIQGTTIWYSVGEREVWLGGFCWLTYIFLSVATCAMLAHFYFHQFFLLNIHISWCYGQINLSAIQGRILIF